MNKLTLLILFLFLSCSCISHRNMSEGKVQKSTKIGGVSPDSFPQLEVNLQRAFPEMPEDLAANLSTDFQYFWTQLLSMRSESTGSQIGQEVDTHILHSVAKDLSRLAATGSVYARRKHSSGNSVISLTFVLDEKGTIANGAIKYQNGGLSIPTENGTVEMSVFYGRKESGLEFATIDFKQGYSANFFDTALPKMLERIKNLPGDPITLAKYPDTVVSGVATHVPSLKQLSEVVIKLEGDIHTSVTTFLNSSLATRVEFSERYQNANLHIEGDSLRSLLFIQTILIAISPRV